jgi:hypothetical protein
VKRESAAIHLDEAHLAADHVNLVIGRYSTVFVDEHLFGDDAARQTAVRPLAMHAAVVTLEPMAHSGTRTIRVDGFAFVQKQDYAAGGSRLEHTRSRQ